jgi:hypothetical protein
MVIFQDQHRRDAIWIHAHGPAFRLQEIVHEVYGDIMNATPAEFTAELLDALYIKGHYSPQRDAIALEGSPYQQYPTVAVDAMTGETWLDPSRPMLTRNVANKPGDPERDPEGRVMVLSPAEREFIELVRMRKIQLDVVGELPEDLFRDVKHDTDCARVSKEMEATLADLDTAVQRDLQSYDQDVAL